MEQTLHIILQIGIANLAAVVFFFGSWAIYSWFADHSQRRKDNLVGVMDDYRAAWMRGILARDNRIVDASILGNIMRSIAFFASTSIFILLGLVTALGYQDEALQLISSIPFAEQNSGFVWELQILLLIVLFVYAFFKYTWSLRQYNYASIVVGAMPEAGQCPREYEETLIAQGAHLLSNAARHFNRGLRAYYFGLAALTWFIHPWLFIAATAWVLYVLYRREFRSQTLEYLSAAKHCLGETS